MYLSTKTITETEKYYKVKEVNSFWSIDRIKSGLLRGDLNIVSVTCVEPILWLVDKNSKRIAVLEKDGGTFHEHTDIQTGEDNCLD